MSNVVEFEVRASIERQAREWLIRLDGDKPLRAAERRELREWMNRSPLHREELTRLAQFWSQANVLTELAVTLEPGKRSAGRRWRWPRIFFVAATCTLASVMLLGWILQRADTVVNGTYGTVIGQQLTIALPDGSSIQLNTDSQVQVAYGAHLRRIRLLRGEGLFSVKPDANRPFEVIAAQNVVRALGTAFAVYLRGSDIDVTVTTGAVEVAEEAPPTAPTPEERLTPQRSRQLGRIKAGQTTTFGGGSDHIEVLQLAEPELQRRTAWSQGYLAFSGEPLSEVIQQFNRYSPVTLEIGDPALAALPIGGRFRIGDLDAVLDALQNNFGIRSQRLDDRNIRLESDHPR